MADEQLEYGFTTAVFVLDHTSRKIGAEDAERAFGDVAKENFWRSGPPARTGPSRCCKPSTTSVATRLARGRTASWTRWAAEADPYPGGPDHQPGGSFLLLRAARASCSVTSSRP